MRSRKNLLFGRACLVLAVALLAGCSGGGSSGSANNNPSATGSGTSSDSATPQEGGTVVAAISAGSTPNFLSPLQTANFLTVANIEGFAQLMWRPLVVIGHEGKPVPDKERSLFQSINYAPDGRSVTVKLKPWQWSDGKPITSRDVEFFYNLVRFNKAQWGYYSKGLFPDNVSSFKVLNDRAFKLVFTDSYNPEFFTDNQLSEITPIPQHAWDRTKSGGAVGNYDRSKSGAQKVWKMLYQAGKDSHHFTSNPLWDVVDGPWKLQTYQTNGKIVFVPNPKYSGPKPHIDKYVNLPFTSDNAEFNALLSGSQIDVGYVPLINSKRAIAQLPSSGYTIKPWYDLGFTFIVPNLTSPDVGAMLSQLYVRQAMQSLIPQKQIIEKIFNGYGVPGTGPVPLKPPSPYVSPLESKGGPYPYNPQKAKTLLQQHGWKVQPGGTRTCEKPGTGPGHCGKGIAQGQKLEFSALFTTGSEATTLEYQAIQSSMSDAGIKLNLRSQPFNTVVGILLPCDPSKKPNAAICQWDLGDWGGWTYSPYPVGPLLFQCGAPDNSQSYCDPKADKLIKDAIHSTDRKAMYRYEDYIAKQVPLLWLPVPAGLVAYKSNLHGVFPVNPLDLPNADQYFYEK